VISPDEMRVLSGVAAFLITAGLAISILARALP